MLNDHKEMKHTKMVKPKDIFTHRMTTKKFNADRRTYLSSNDLFMLEDAVLSLSKIPSLFSQIEQWCCGPSDYLT